VDSLFAVDASTGQTRIASIDEASRDMLKQQLFSAGELLRLNQLAPDPKILEAQEKHPTDLFADAE
jgi:hypothetical protein